MRERVVRLVRTGTAIRRLRVFRMDGRERRVVCVIGSDHKRARADRRDGESAQSWGGIT